MLDLIEVELWSAEPPAVEAVRRTVEGLAGGALHLIDGHYFVPSGFVAWACEKQGYVKRLIGPGVSSAAARSPR